MLAVDSSEFELEKSTRSKIAYELFERAMLIHEQIQHARSLSKIISVDYAENIMISVARAVEKKAFGSRHSASAHSVKHAIDRIRDLEANGYANPENNFNSAKEMLASLAKSHEANAKAYQDGLDQCRPKERQDYLDKNARPVFDLRAMNREALALLIDSMPCGSMSESLSSALDKAASRRMPAEPSETQKKTDLSDKLGQRRGRQAKTKGDASPSA